LIIRKQHFAIASTLSKAAHSTAWKVGGIASSFHRDLDGEAIVPTAVRDAIPDFMAVRGADGVEGGPIRLHHDYWQPFLQRIIRSLDLSTAMQMELVAAIALPIGRVTEMTVDGEGRTHWAGFLSPANPIAKIVWEMLREGFVHLGVSLGGRIMQVVDGGRDAIGKPCRLITQIRIDELSVTDNPALRITDGSDDGAYIMALAKSILGPRTTLRPKAIATSRSDTSTQRFLSKALGEPGGAALFNSGDTTVNAMGMSKPIGPQHAKKPGASGKVKVDSTEVKTGMGKDDLSYAVDPPKSTGKGPPSDVWGISVGALAAGLAKCAEMTKAEEWAAAVPMMRDSSQGLIGLTENPPMELLNLVRLLADVARYSSELPYMNKSMAEATMLEMGSDLTKAANAFAAAIPGELKGKPLRPPGSKSIAALDIAYPQQYSVS
jgi:hypothetical protein